MKQQPFPVPADFTAYAPGKSLVALAAHYGVSHTTITRWRVECGIKVLHGVRITAPKEPPPQHFARIAPTLTMREAKAFFGKGSTVMERWAEEAGVSYRRAHSPKGQRQPVDRPRRDMSLAGQAADYLRKVAPIWRCDADGRALHDGFFWRWAGRRVLSDDEIMAMATRKGWDADAWKRIAA